jgi:hypothetical protein
MTDFGTLRADAVEMGLVHCALSKSAKSANVGALRECNHVRNERSRCFHGFPVLDVATTSCRQRHATVNVLAAMINAFSGQKAHLLDEPQPALLARAKST